MNENENKSDNRFIGVYNIIDKAKVSKEERELVKRHPIIIPAPQ